MNRTIALLLSYDGTNYHGWQTQANAVSVQSTLTNAFSNLLNDDIKLTGCGRTDTGVHAKKYVATLKTTSSFPVARIPYAINSMLPNDISVHFAHEVSDDFHPVHSCTEKEYTYYIDNSPVRNPFLTNRALHHRFTFDIDKVTLAARNFLGEHDFSSMRSLGTPVKSTVRTIYKCDVLKSGNIIAVTISANGFLYNMARTIVGTLLDVSSGKIPPEAISEILKSSDRNRAGATAPAHALYMTDVIYPTEFGLPNVFYGGF